MQPHNLYQHVTFRMPGTYRVTFCHRRDDASLIHPYLGNNLKASPQWNNRNFNLELGQGGLTLGGSNAIKNRAYGDNKRGQPIAVLCIFRESNYEMLSPQKALDGRRLQAYFPALQLQYSHLFCVEYPHFPPFQLYMVLL